MSESDANSLVDPVGCLLAVAKRPRPVGYTGNIRPCRAPTLSSDGHQRFGASDNSLTVVQLDEIPRHGKEAWSDTSCCEDTVMVVRGKAAEEVRAATMMLFMANAHPPMTQWEIARSRVRSISILGVDACTTRSGDRSL